MKSVFILLFVSVFFISCSKTEKCEHSAANPAEFEKKVKEADQDWFNYVLNEDVAGFEKILAKDVSLEFPRMKLSRQQFIDAIKSGTYLYDKVERITAEFRFYGTTAVENGIYKIDFRKKNEKGELNPMQDRIAFTAVYAQTDSSKIQLVAWQGTMREE